MENKGLNVTIIINGLITLCNKGPFINLELTIVNSGKA